MRTIAKHWALGTRLCACVALLLSSCANGEEGGASSPPRRGDASVSDTGRGGSSAEGSSPSTGGNSATGGSTAGAPSSSAGGAGAPGTPEAGPVDSHADADDGEAGEAQESGSDATPGGCSSDSDCTASAVGKVCDPAQGLCVPCLASQDVCQKGSYCKDKACVPGCRANDDCGAADAGIGCGSTCDTASHTCNGCCTDSECPNGQVCDPSHTCVDGCTDAHACQSGKSCCGGTCFNVASDVAHCGSCGNKCNAPSHGAATCTSGSCAVKSCDSGYADCNKQWGDGCEVNLPSDSNNCGTCGKKCTATGGNPTCSNSTCGVSCDADHADCNNRTDDGCETAINTTTNCGSCGHRCQITSASAQCTNHNCAIQACYTSFGDCNNDPADGCESSLVTQQRCGSCTNACASGTYCQGDGKCYAH